jgi:hypothetical protein
LIICKVSWLRDLEPNRLPKTKSFSGMWIGSSYYSDGLAEDFHLTSIEQITLYVPVTIPMT